MGSYNGGACLAMTGKDCVAIASDLRYGIQAQTVGMNFPKVFEMGPKLYMGLAGLATDIQTVHDRLQFRLKLYSLRENRDIKPKTFMTMVSNLLYERRFGPYFIEPIIADWTPRRTSPSSARSISSAAPWRLRTSSFPALATNSSTACASRCGSRIWTRTRCSRRCLKRCSMPLTETPYPVGAASSTSSRRTRSPRVL